MKYLIIILITLSSCINPVKSLKTSPIEGNWENGTAVIKFNNNWSFALYSNNEPITKNGVYNIKRDSIYLQYNDRYLNWERNTQTIYYKLLSDTTMIIVSAVYERM